MLEQSDFPIDDAIEFFASHGIESAFFVPTHTGIQKSIIDAHESLRTFLLRHDVHDYQNQLQGPEHKIVLPARVVTATAVTETQVSFYRPKTKNGDPRFWVYKLPEFAEPRNLIAVVADEFGTFSLINLSDRALWKSRQDPHSAFRQILSEIAAPESAAIELHERILEISELGFVPSIAATREDRSIGLTLKHLLGISPNSSKIPDYKGIELKAGRGNPRNRVNLFSQVPDWKNSRVQTAVELIETYGYYSEADQRQALYCTVGPRPNPQGLYFDISTDGQVNCLSKYPADATEVVQWQLSNLEARLAEKHTETFWVNAISKMDTSGREHFHFNRIVHTKDPYVSHLGPLIEQGVVTMDFTMHIKENGKSRDHGYLFKILPEKLELLFPPPQEYLLSATPKFAS